MLPPKKIKLKETHAYAEGLLRGAKFRTKHIGFRSAEQGGAMEKITFSETIVATTIVRAKAKNNCLSYYAKVDYAIEEVKDLIPDTWINWHRSAAHKLGITRYLELSRMAREGSTPARLFSHLISKALRG